MTKELSDMLRLTLKDPRLRGVTITRVRVSDDLSFARIYYNILGGPQELEDAQAALEKATGFIRRQLKSRLDIRRIPELRFQYDDSVDYAQRIDTLLRQIGEEQTEAAANHHDSESEQEPI